MIYDQSLALGTPAISLNGSVPPGEHPDGLPPVKPRSDYCQDCHPLAYRRAALLVCRSCGWVMCSDDSPGHEIVPRGHPARVLQHLHLAHRHRWARRSCCWPTTWSPAAAPDAAAAAAAGHADGRTGEQAGQAGPGRSRHGVLSAERPNILLPSKTAGDTTSSHLPVARMTGSGMAGSGVWPPGQAGQPRCPGVSSAVRAAAVAAVEVPGPPQQPVRRILLRRRFRVSGRMPRGVFAQAVRRD